MHQAIVFNPVPPGMTLPSERRPMRRAEITVTMPSSDEELAFLPVTHLAKLVETRQVKPSELTELYLARLRRHDPTLHCVVSYTEDIARRQARQADEEIAGVSTGGLARTRGAPRICSGSRTADQWPRLTVHSDRHGRRGIHATH